MDDIISVEFKFLLLKDFVFFSCELCGTYVTTIRIHCIKGKKYIGCFIALLPFLKVVLIYPEKICIYIVNFKSEPIKILL